MENPYGEGSQRDARNQGGHLARPSPDRGRDAAGNPRPSAPPVSPRHSPISPGHSPRSPISPGDKIIDIDSLKTFTIPKKKKQQKELLEPVALNSREFHHDLLPIINKSLRDNRMQKDFKFTRVYMVHNKAFLDQYLAKRKEMRQEGYSDKEVHDSYGFLCMDSEAQVKQICEEGLKVGHTKISCLGNPTMGVCVARHVDIVRPINWTKGYQGRLIVFKIMKGKVKSMIENREAVQLDPTPNFDCHVSKSANADLSSLSPQHALESTQIYLYEYGDLGVEERPRQVLPYAVVHFVYTGETKSYKPAAQRPAVKPGMTKRPVAGGRPEKPDLSLSVSQHIKHPQHQPAQGVPTHSASPQHSPASPDSRRKLASQRSKGSSGRAPSPSQVGAITESGGCVVWSGKLVSKGAAICGTELVTFGTYSKPCMIGRELNISCRISQKLFNEKYCPYLSGLQKEAEVTTNGSFYSYCELRPLKAGQAKFNQVMTYLTRKNSMAVVKMSDNSELLIMPNCEFTQLQGLSLANHHPLILHVVYVSSMSRLTHFQDLATNHLSPCASPSSDQKPTSVPGTEGKTMGPGGDAPFSEPPQPQRVRSAPSLDDSYFHGFKRFVPVGSLIYRNTIIQAFRQQTATQEGTFDPKTGSWNTTQPLPGYHGPPPYGGPREGFPDAAGRGVPQQGPPFHMGAPPHPQRGPLHVKLPPPMPPIQPDVSSANMPQQSRWLQMHPQAQQPGISPQGPRPGLPSPGLGAQGAGLMSQDSPMQKLEEITQQLSPHSVSLPRQLSSPGNLQASGMSNLADPSFPQARRHSDEFMGQFPFSVKPPAYEIAMSQAHSPASRDISRIPSQFSPVTSVPPGQQLASVRQPSPTRVDPRLNRSSRSPVSPVDISQSAYDTSTTMSFSQSSQILGDGKMITNQTHLDSQNPEQSNLCRSPSVGNQPPLVGAAITTSIATASTTTITTVGAAKHRPAEGLTTDVKSSATEGRGLVTKETAVAETEMAIIEGATVKPEFKVPTAMPPRYQATKIRRSSGSPTKSPPAAGLSFPFSTSWRETSELTDEEADAIIKSAGRKSLMEEQQGETQEEHLLEEQDVEEEEGNSEDEFVPSPEPEDPEGSPEQEESAGDRASLEQTEEDIASADDSEPDTEIAKSPEMEASVTELSVQEGSKTDHESLQAENLEAEQTLSEKELACVEDSTVVKNADAKTDEQAALIVKDDDRKMESADLSHIEIIESANESPREDSRVTVDQDKLEEVALETSSLSEAVINEEKVVKGDRERTEVKGYREEKQVKADKDKMGVKRSHEKERKKKRKKDREEYRSESRKEKSRSAEVHRKESKTGVPKLKVTKKVKTAKEAIAQQQQVLDLLNAGVSPTQLALFSRIPKKSDNKPPSGQPIAESTCALPSGADVPNQGTYVLVSGTSAPVTGTAAKASSLQVKPAFKLCESSAFGDALIAATAKVHTQNSIRPKKVTIVKSSWYAKNPILSPKSQLKLASTACRKLTFRPDSTKSQISTNIEATRKLKKKILKLKQLKRGGGLGARGELDANIAGKAKSASKSALCLRLARLGIRASKAAIRACSARSLWISLEKLEAAALDPGSSQVQSHIEPSDANEVVLCDETVLAEETTDSTEMEAESRSLPEAADLEQREVAAGTTTEKYETVAESPASPTPADAGEKTEVAGQQAGNLAGEAASGETGKSVPKATETKEMKERRERAEAINLIVRSAANDNRKVKVGNKLEDVIIDLTWDPQYFLFPECVRDKEEIREICALRVLHRWPLFEQEEESKAESALGELWYEGLHVLLPKLRSNKENAEDGPEREVLEEELEDDIPETVEEAELGSPGKGSRRDALSGPTMVDICDKLLQDEASGATGGTMPKDEIPDTEKSTPKDKTPVKVTPKDKTPVKDDTASLVAKETAVDTVKVASEQKESPEKKIEVSIPASVTEQLQITAQSHDGDKRHVVTSEKKEGEETAKDTGSKVSITEKLKKMAKGEDTRKVVQQAPPGPTRVDVRDDRQSRQFHPYKPPSFKGEPPIHLLQSKYPDAINFEELFQCMTSHLYHNRTQQLGFRSIPSLASRFRGYSYQSRRQGLFRRKDLDKEIPNRKEDIKDFEQRKSKTQELDIQLQTWGQSHSGILQQLPDEEVERSLYTDFGADDAVQPVTATLMQQAGAPRGEIPGSTGVTPSSGGLTRHGFSSSFTPQPMAGLSSLSLPHQQCHPDMKQFHPATEQAHPEMGLDTHTSGQFHPCTGLSSQSPAQIQTAPYKNHAQMQGQHPSLNGGVNIPHRQPHHDCTLL